MTIAKIIPKPVDWPNFETLCEKIFRYEWPCPSIMKNGRSGQTQYGVDISGLPEGRTGYWGVQCKGKDGYTTAKLTKADVDESIRLAQDFRPSLEMLIFATSANKDARMEQHVREADVASRARGGFGVSVYHWEDLARRIEDHRHVYDWWMRDKRHLQRYAVEFGFDSTSRDTFIVRPRYRRVTKVVQSIDPTTRMIKSIQEQMSPRGLRNLGFGQNPAITALFRTRSVLSWCRVPFLLKNCGDEVLEDFELELEVEDDETRLGDGLSGPLIPRDIQRRSPVWTSETKRAGYRAQGPLVQSHDRVFEIWIKPPAKEVSIRVRWRLVARDFDDKGVLALTVDPDFKDETEVSTTDDPSEAGESVEFKEIYEGEHDE
jgi:hypothetical protein